MKVEEIKEGQSVYLAPNKVQVHKARVIRKVKLPDGVIKLEFDCDREVKFKKPECGWIFDNENEANEYFEKNVQVK